MELSYSEHKIKLFKEVKEPRAEILERSLQIIHIIIRL
jgi:hypothetical protein